MNPSKKIFFSWIAFPVLILTIFVFVLFPQIQKIQRDVQILISVKKEHQALVQRELLLREFQQFFSQHKTDINKLQERFLDPENPIDFLQSLEHIARESDISLKILPGNVQKLPGDPWPFIEFQLSLEGRYPQFLSFLKKLESAPYILEFGGLTITTLKEKKDQIQAFLFLRAYTAQPTQSL